MGWGGASRVVEARLHTLQHAAGVIARLRPPGPQVHPEGKYVVDIDKTIDITKLKPNDRVALKNDSYVLHLVPPCCGKGRAGRAPDSATAKRDRP